VKTNPPLCWICDRRLWVGGRSFVIIQEDGQEHPAHKGCAQKAGVLFQENARQKP